MLLRLILAVCMMIGVLMPCAWASESPDFEITASQSEKEKSSYQDSPLSKLVIDTDEWFEDDTYHICYTFTNPTDELINETITRTFIEVHTSTGTSLSNSVVKQDPSLEWRLILPPHSSTKHVVTLPKEPCYIHFFHNQTIFELSDGNVLYYTLRKQDITPPAKLDIHFDPIALNKGSFSITVTNQSPHLLSSMKHFMTRTPTNIKDPFLINTSASITTTLPDLIPLNLPPNESKTFHLTTPIPTHLDIPHPPRQTLCSFEIDDISFTYFDYKKDYTLSKRTVSYQPTYDWSESSFHPVAVRGNIEVTDNSAIYYLTIQNNFPSTTVLRSLDMVTEYKNSFQSMKFLHCTLSLEKTPLVLYPYQKKYCRLVLPLLTDTPEQTLHAITAFDRESQGSFILFRRPRISAEPLYSLQKILYQPLHVSSIAVESYYPYIFSIL